MKTVSQVTRVVIGGVVRLMKNVSQVTRVVIGGVVRLMKTVSQVTRVVIGGVVMLAKTVSQVTRVVIGGVVRLMKTVSQVTRVVPLIGSVVMLKSLAAVIMTVIMATPVREPMLTSVAYVGGYNWLLSGLDICVIYFGSNSDV